MNIDTKVLDLLFCRVTPERILHDLKDQLQNPMLRDSRAKTKDIFENFAEATLHAYSIDEQILIRKHTEKLVKDSEAEIGCPASALFLLIQCGKDLLSESQDGLVCKRDRIMEWREVFLRLGQNTVACPYLAWMDLHANNRERTFFAWPAILKTDDRQLQYILDQGVAENHRHLVGSTQSFDLSWIKLMNDLSTLEDDLKLFKKQYQAGFSRGPEDNVLSIRERVELAALVRTMLFRLIHRDQFACPSETGGRDRNAFCAENAFRAEYLYSFSPVSTAMSLISQLQDSYGAKTDYPEQNHVCLDYALEPHIFKAVENEPYRVLAGERYLLYQCSKEILRNHFSEFEKELFFLYNQLRIAFRGELIQVNDQVGFENFAQYQNRKSSAWGDVSCYWYESGRMSLSGAFSVDNHSTAESRSGPKKSVQGNIDLIAGFDNIKRFGDGIQHPELPTPEEALKEKHFYVLHFTKKEDDTKGTGEFLILRRHDELRDTVRESAVALAAALSKSEYLCARVRGIDAASNETRARPEVFASAFRFLRGFRVEDFVPNAGDTRRVLPRISVTFHAGEDFFDIADGLRTIDEAIDFLGYRHGDRIGHALALGVAPELHYGNKDYISVMSKQTYLDNLVWLLFRSVELGVPIGAILREKMKRKAESLLQEIYGDAIERNGWHVGLREYYHSMKLRGDEPNLYKRMTFQKPDDWLDPYARFEVNDSDQMLENLRSDHQIAGLYYVYEFGTKEKEAGSEETELNVDTQYINLIRDMQDAMQKYLAEKGIMIECNPSSNVLIGTFREYDQHPLFRFNNEYLDEAPRQQLCVSVNTDDLGVFDTSLEFEYALVYQTLKEMKDDKGNQRYRDSDIRKYLENLQAMGKKMVFPPAQMG